MVAGAIGDAMGGPVEGYSAEKIAADFGWINDFVTGPGTRSETGDAGAWWTDDTYLRTRLAEMYVRTGRHSTADDFAFEWRETIEPRRVFWFGQWTWTRIKYTDVDPKFAGVGNAIDCGCAMYIEPVGVVNACRPSAAYREALNIGCISVTGHGLEAAGVLAAGVAAACAPGATARSVCDAALALARDGTRKTLEVALEAAEKLSDHRKAIMPIRDAIAEVRKGPAAKDSIEEVPAAFAVFLAAKGSTMDSVEAGVNYGNDNDSIAGMAGCLAGAMNGTAGMPEALVDRMQERMKFDLRDLAHRFGKTVAAILADDIKEGEAAGPLLRR